MKPRDQVRRQILDEWLAKARDDAAVAERLLPEGPAFSNAVAFHSQQAAEKYLKAFLAWIQIDFPRTHDLAELLALVARANASLAGQLHDAAALTPYGVELRYPADRADASEQEAHEAVRLARKVRDAILPLLPQGPR